MPLLLNAPGWWYVTGRAAMQTPSNGPDAALAAAGRYGGTHLVMEPVHPHAWDAFAADPASQPRFHLVGQRQGYLLYQIAPP